MKIFISGTPTFRLRSIIKKPRTELEIFPFNQGGIEYYFSGRYALYAGIQALNISQGKTVLLPSYNCGTEVDPFIHNGLNIKFYKIAQQTYWGRVFNI